MAERSTVMTTVREEPVKSRRWPRPRKLSAWGEGIKPSSIFLFANDYTGSGSKNTINYTRHNGTAGILFADGHTEQVTEGKALSTHGYDGAADRFLKAGFCP